MTATLTINKANLTIYIDNKTSIYGQPLMELTYRMSGNIYNDEVQVYLQKQSGSNAGTYTITAQANNANYNITTYDGTYTIAKASYDLSEVTFLSESVVYDGHSHSILIDGSLPSGLSVSYEGNDQVEVGNYTIQANFTNNNDNYYDVSPRQVRLTILPATIEGVTLSSKSVDYDGQTHSLDVEGLPEDANLTFTSTNAFRASGTYQISAIVSKHGHSDLYLTATLTIVGKDIDMSKISFPNQTFVYDGLEKVSMLEGPLPEGIIGVDYSNNRRTDVGEIYPVVRFLVDEAYNPISNRTATLTITKASIEQMSFTGGVFTYDGLVKSFHISELFTRYGDKLDVTYSGDLTYIDAGTYVVTATFTHSNYEPLLITSELLIEKASRQFSIDDFTYIVTDGEVLINPFEFDDLLYFSVNDEPYQMGTEILNLEADTLYNISLYLEETDNYLMSDIVNFQVRTYGSILEVENLFEDIEGISITTRDDILLIMEGMEKLAEEDYEKMMIQLDALIGDYNNWIGTLTQEYQIAEQIEQRILPYELFIPNNIIIPIEQCRKREKL